MTVLSRGARSRRSGRRPGWPLVTALLVLAIAASSALVFTNRVELLKLAVILALWAAVVAAFVSVIYRRQGDADAAKARDLKLVYDLQLDREISARREYELTVESQLRRELASELRAQSADEVAALRAELAALRNNLEILFETELTHRPAIETDRTTIRAYSDWAREVGDAGRSTRFRQQADVDTGENRIIDVPEEPEPEPEPQRGGYASDYDGRYAADYGGGYAADYGGGYAADYGTTVNAGSHHWPSENGGFVPRRPEPQPRPAPEPAAAEPAASQGKSPEAAASVGGRWNPAPAEGHWLPAGTPGSNWEPTNGVSANRGAAGDAADTSGSYPPGVSGSYPPGEPEPLRGRHSSPPEETGATFPTPQPAPFPPPEEPARHTIPAGAPTTNSQHGEGQGQSVAELLARLRATPAGGGRRRRREE